MYLRIGLSLALFKYAVDASVIGWATGDLWSPVDYLVPLLSVRGSTADALPTWLMAGLIGWSLPFLWIGVGMSMRRAVDAGRSPWWCLLFFVPGLNYLLMLVLSLLPSARSVDWKGGRVTPTTADRLRSAFAGVGAAFGVGLLSVVVGTFVLKTYGLALFLATPFLLGVVSAFVYNRRHPRTSIATCQVVFLSLGAVGGSLILFALEGLLCLLLALPLGAVLAFFGGEIGRAVAIRSSAGPSAVALSLLLLPTAAGMDAVAPPAPLVETVTSVVIDAPPERVWEEVVAFREIEAPPEILFRLGIAYPVRARLSGTGVGAVRRCEFSTGAFVEPITTWHPPRRLAFDVAEQPPVLQEWSPYRRVYAPHLEGFFRSTRGEFLLVPLPGGRTRLEGSTWFTLELRPRVYWSPIAEALLHRIHARVLDQIERQAED